MIEGWFLWPRPHCLTQLGQIQEGGVCRCAFMLGEMSLLMSLACFDLILVWGKILPRSSPSPSPSRLILTSSWPESSHILIPNQSLSEAKWITMIGLKYVYSLELGERLSVPEYINVQ